MKPLIIGVGIGSFPYGSASTVRILALLKGLKELLLDVKLFIIFPDKNQEEASSQLNAVYEGIPFWYTTNYLDSETNSIVRYYRLLKSLFKFLRIVLKEKRNREIVIFNFITVPIISIIMTSFLKGKNIILIHEVTEYPFLMSSNSKIGTFLYLKYSIPKYKKLYVISNSLKEYFQKYYPVENIEVLNMVVDPKRFEGKPEKLFEFDYIAYCGSMNTDKDGVPTLVEAFSIVNLVYPNMRLVLIGDIKKRPVNSNILEAINRNKLNERVHFTGYISNQEIP
jgi:glycosyltransferase involved in cell wall biosynthesis